MKMAKPSNADIDAAGDLMSLLEQIDRGHYPGDREDGPTFFDERDPEHLRAFYDEVRATLNRAPGYPGRVIGGMCYVIMYDKNEIVDPESDVIELHPRLLKALESCDLQAQPDQRPAASCTRELLGFGAGLAAGIAVPAAGVLIGTISAALGLALTWLWWHLSREKRGAPADQSAMHAEDKA